MNQVYNNPLIIRNIEFKEYLTEKEALKKIDEFRFSDAGQALPDNKKNSLNKIANYFVTHPNFDEVSDDHVLIREGYPVIFTSKNYRKLKYEKPIKKAEEIGESSNKNSQSLVDDDDDGGESSINTLAKSNLLKKSNTSDMLRAKGIGYEKTLVLDEDVDNKATQEISARKDNSGSNELKIITAKKKVPKNQSSVIMQEANGVSKDNSRENKAAISPPKKKKKKKKKYITEESNASIEKDTQEIGLIQENDIERVNIGPSKQSGFNGGGGTSVKKNKTTKESKLIKYNGSVKGVKSGTTKEKKSKKSKNEANEGNEATIITPRKRTQENKLIDDMINVKKVKVDPPKNSVVNEESNDINNKINNESSLIQSTSKVVDEVGLIQGTAKVKGKKKRKKSKEESNITNTIQEIVSLVSPENNISKVRNDKKDFSKESGLKKDKSIPGKGSTDTDNVVTIKMKKGRRKNLK